MESATPLGRYADVVAALVTTSIVLTFLATHALLIAAPILGAQAPLNPDTAQLDTAAVAVLGYVLGGVIRSRSSAPPAVP